MILCAIQRMAQIWQQTNSQGWAPTTIDGVVVFALTPAPEPPGGQDIRQPEPGQAFLRRSTGRNPREATWVLFTPVSVAVSVNGCPMLLGIRVLQDKDEIVVAGGRRFFFSNECLATIEPFPGAGQVVFCARCKQEIAKSASAVRCPGCGIWCHESDELRCWTYATACPLCDKSTALDAGYSWTPEEL